MEETGGSWLPRVRLDEYIKVWGLSLPDGSAPQWGGLGGSSPCVQQFEATRSGVHRNMPVIFILCIQASWQLSNPVSVLWPTPLPSHSTTRRLWAPWSAHREKPTIRSQDMCKGTRCVGPWTFWEIKNMRQDCRQSGQQNTLKDQRPRRMFMSLYVPLWQSKILFSFWKRRIEHLLSHTSVYRPVFTSVFNCTHS